MSLDQLLAELQLEKIQLQAITNPSDITTGKIAALTKIIGRIEHNKCAQLKIRLKLPFEIE